MVKPRNSHNIAVRALAVAALSLLTLQPALALDERRAKELVVMIDGKIGDTQQFGAGVVFGVGSDRLYIVTANHLTRKGLVEGRDFGVILRWLPGERVEARLMRNYDRDLDISVLAVAGLRSLNLPDLDWRVLADVAAIQTGTRVVPLGNPAGNAWFVPRQFHVVNSVSNFGIMTEGNLLPGNSGGGLFTADWHLAGLVSNTGALLGESTRIDRVVERLNSWGFPVKLGAAAQASLPEEYFPPAKVSLRSEPATLSDADVMRMLERNGFYGSTLNPDARDFPNEFKVRQIAGQEVVIDYATTLMWKRTSSEATYTWYNAGQYVADLNGTMYAGFNDWRVPTIEEIASLMEPVRHEGHIAPEFLLTSDQDCWTSDRKVYETAADTAWAAGFSYGGFVHGGHANNRFCVLAVRSAR